MPERNGHPFAVAVLLAVAALLGAVAIGAIWANRQLLDTGGWVRVSGRMLESREVRHRLATFLAEELVSEAEGRLGAAGEGGIAEEVVPPLRRRGPRLAERAMGTQRFRVVWLRANREAHQALVRILDGENSGGGTGPLVVNLTPALRELASSFDDEEFVEQLGVGDLGSLIEPGAARIEILEAAELTRAQSWVRRVRDLQVPATIATLVLLALALLVGRARLRRTILGVGLSLAVAGAIALIVRAVAGHQIVDDLLSGHADREAAEAAWRIATSTVVDLSAAAIGLGALIVLSALLSGESGAAVGVRRALAPLLRTPLARLWMLLAAILVFLVLMVWSPIAAFEHPLGIVLFAAVFGAGSAALARKTIAEDAPGGAPVDWG
jgi:hypothetical protein